MSGFLFATGIENSYPVIAGGTRVDEMEKCGHYRRWREDLALVRQLGLSYLRWGPAIYQTFLGPGRYDWSWVDDVLEEMRRLRIQPILDLCHFGLPDWLGHFQNRDFPEYFAEYAAAFARRYPEIRHWTPINEILITALFSARYGWWNEQLASDAAFVRALLNLCRANLLAMHAIRRQTAAPVFVQSESIEYTHPSTPDLEKEAQFQNERRFLPLDLTYGQPLSALMEAYLRDQGMSLEEEAFFARSSTRSGCVLGTDYYATNEHLVKPGGSTAPSGEFYGYYVIARQYYHRYGLPLMHTETNRWDKDDAPQWLWKQWHCLLRLCQDDIPVLGFTWYSLTDQMDWDTALRRDDHRVNPVGLFDLDRNLRPVGQHYRQLIRDWQGFLPGQEVTPPHQPRRRVAA
ncbi:MAG: family 1 glycosylhydrolase [Planctomycetes bacterium]|nr:family 1 glycosylhydrolase [Planctomycetota bacterium]